MTQILSLLTLAHSRMSLTRDPRATTDTLFGQRSWSRHFFPNILPTWKTLTSQGIPTINLHMGNCHQ